jgi:ribosomal protein L19E
MLQIPSWHRPYADLLLETDAVKRAALISRLEQEIVNRHLEHSVSPITPDEQLDLMNAADVLRLKKNEIMALIKQRFIAAKLGTARVRSSIAVSRIPEKQRRGRQGWKGSLRHLRWLYARLPWKGQHAKPIRERQTQ